MYTEHFTIEVVKRSVCSICGHVQVWWRGLGGEVYSPESTNIDEQ